MAETVWDNIYKDYLTSGQAWASIKDGLHPDFHSFLDGTSFRVKNALDIGCGTGKYLRYLKDNGFQVSGIDSSESAIRMTVELLEGQGEFIVADMYRYSYPTEVYDFIISHCTLHHGTRKEVVSLLGKIYQALLPDGKIFISLPCSDGKKHWIMMSEHETLEDGTCIPLSGPEKGLAHSFYSHADIEQLFSPYHDLQIGLDEKDSRWIISATK